MSRAPELLDRLRAERVVAILRAVPDAARVIDGIIAGGVGVVEITLDSPGAADEIARTRERHPEALVGAGTVRTAADVDVAVAAGAAFCVAPATVEAALARAAELGVPMIPGALTPSEIERAWGLGAAAVKLFPAGAGGPRYLREVLAPLRDVPLMATGGVTAANLRDFLDAGAVAVGVGSALVAADDPAAAARELIAAAG